MLRHRDPKAIREVFPYIAAMADHYFRSRVEGVEHLSDEGSLLVSTHNGGIAMPDLYCLFVAYFRHFGLETPVYGLAHSFALKIPGFGPTISKFGAIPASRENASLVLREGFPLLVCPGGDEDSLKPFARRHEIRFGRRRGFIRLAIKEQVPLVPVVSVGAHETMMVLNDGRRLARSLMLDRLFRIKSAPLTLSFPQGLGIAGLGSLPLPAKIRSRVLEPIFLHEPPSAANDPERVEACFEHVRDKMQAALSQLATRRKRVFFG